MRIRDRVELAVRFGQFWDGIGQIVIPASLMALGLISAWVVSGLATGIWGLR